LACHQTGVGGAPQIPADHAGRTNDMCRLCHQPGPASEGVRPTAQATAVLTTTVTAVATQTVAAPATRVAAGPPLIPHTLEGRTACLACHQTGVGGAPQIPADHAGRTNDMCRLCHQPGPASEGVQPTAPATAALTSTATAVATATLAPEATPTAAVALPVPHPLAGFENCLACHVSAESTEMPTEMPTVVPVEGPPAIPHPLIGRANCLACHQEGIGGAPKIPADHAGRASETCQSCHQPAQIPAAPTPTASSEPIPTPIVYPTVQGANTCFDCHSRLGGKQADITAQWSRSVHGERNVACADCHGGNLAANTVDQAMSPAAGYIGVPAKTDIPALCASCHADASRMRQFGLPTDQYAQYRVSVHGMRLATGDGNVATCDDCHGGHQVLRPDDPSSTVYPANVPRTCANCHSNQALMASYGIPANQFDLYRKSVHGQVLLDDQDFRAPTCATCHGTHGAAPPGAKEVADVCGTCHGATEAYYQKSPHAKLAAAVAPRCVACHGNHDVAKPGEALFLGAEPEHCGACHAPDGAPDQLARTLYDTVAAAAQAYGSAEAAVQSAQQVGMLVSPLEGQLSEATTNLITARAAQHTLDIATVRTQADDARATADQVKASADAQVAESIFRRRAMVLAVAAIGVTIVALYLLKRELDRRLDRD
jgi:hypothetical protein